MFLPGESQGWGSLVGYSPWPSTAQVGAAAVPAEAELGSSGAGWAPWVGPGKPNLPLGGPGVLGLSPFVGPPGWASLVAQLVKNLPAMQENQVQALGWEDPLKKEMATHSSTPTGAAARDCS